MGKKKLRLKRLTGIAVVLAVRSGCFFLYVADYYHADANALAALNSDGTVTVTRTAEGWLFDGPSESDALIFYPGAKIEEASYAPLMHLLAEKGMDAFLIEMPFHLSIFGKDKADNVISGYKYDHFYIGGHSLGGAMAAEYASGHHEQLTGIVMLAAYSLKHLDDSLAAVTIYGSEDGVLNMGRLAAGEKNLPVNAGTCVIQGGNHAQFGNYGEQKGDGKASISAQEQQRQTVELILQNK